VSPEQGNRALAHLQLLNGKQGTELADLIVHKITEAVNAIAFK